MLDIVVAEDDRIIRNGIVEFINEHLDEGRVVAFFTDGSEVIRYLRTHQVDIIITDVQMYETSGLEVAKYVYENNIKTAVIIISAYRDFTYAHQAISYHVCSYLLKPIMPKELREAISRAQKFLNGDNFGKEIDQTLPDVEKTGNDSSVKEERVDRDELLMQRALDFIHKNYSQDISLSDVANYVYLSEHYFGSIFKNNMKEGFVQYLNTVRLDEAIRLLQTGLYSVKEISYKVGYKNCNYFIKLFKAYTGVTPKQYCLMHKSNDTGN